VKPSILAVTSELPWPLTSGGRLRTFHMLRELTQDFQVRLVAGVDSDCREGVETLQRAGILVRAVSLRPRSALAESRRLLAAAAHREPYVLYRRHDRPEIRAVVRAELANEPPDAFYLDHLDSFVFASEGRGTPIVLDLHNIYSLLIRRESAATERRWIARRFLRREATLLGRIEAAAVRHADVVFGVSEQEQAHFARLRESAVHLVPNGVECAKFAGLPTGRASSPPAILFIGTLSWPPNVQAVRFLAKDVLPAVRRQIPHATLQLVGRDPAAEVSALAVEGVTVAGNVADILPYLSDASLLAVPLETGGGTRLKILEAFAAGLPVVSTAIGSEGLGAANGRELTIVELPAFADAICSLLTNPAQADAQASRARALARTQFDWPIVGRTARAAIAAQLSKGNASAAPQQE
jgi:glycosyltransferase involved in cell wall biosynthesis